MKGLEVVMNGVKASWGDRVEEAFLQQKKLLDRVSFWYLTIPGKNTAMEYFYQLCNKEITFADIKKEHPDAQYFPERKLKTSPTKSLRKILQKMNLNVPHYSQSIMGREDLYYCRSRIAHRLNSINNDD